MKIHPKSLTTLKLLKNKPNVLGSSDAVALASKEICFDFLKFCDCFFFLPGLIQNSVSLASTLLCSYFSVPTWLLIATRKFVGKNCTSITTYTQILRIKVWSSRCDNELPVLLSVSALGSDSTDVIFVPQIWFGIKLGHFPYLDMYIHTQHSRFKISILQL